jgi:hypothetical protein
VDDVSSATWKSNVAGAIAAVQAANAEAVQDVTEDLLASSRATIPYQEGDLSRSGQASVDGGGDVVDGNVSFDTVYARVQHEHPEFRHEVGTYNYLGGPLNTNRDRYHALIAARIKAALGE